MALNIRSSRIRRLSLRSSGKSCKDLSARAPNVELRPARVLQYHPRFRPFRPNAWTLSFLVVMQCTVGGIRRDTCHTSQNLTRIPKVSIVWEKRSDEDREIVCTIRCAHLFSDVTTLKLFWNLRISASSVLWSEYRGNHYNVRFYPSGEISGNARDNNFRLRRAKERALDNSVLLRNLLYF